MAPPRRKPRRIGAQAPKRRAVKPAARTGNTDAARGGSSHSGSDSRSGSCSGSSRSSEDRSSSGESASDEDDPRDYKHGGYHPVTPYQVYSARYRVLSKLGAGAFSTVWLCADEKNQIEAGPELLAMKVCKSKRSVTEQAMDEIALFERLQEGTTSPHVVQLRGHFWHSGPNGRHKCMVFEVMGENLLTLVKHFDYDGLPIPWVQRISRHTLEGLAFVHSRGVIHTDVKLENVLVQRHDLHLMYEEGRKAHRAFTEQRKLTGAAQANSGNLSKSQKKRQKKKAKAAQAKEDEKIQEELLQADQAGAVDEGDLEADAEGDTAAADTAAAAACGRPVPPVRQRARLESLQLDQVFAKLADFGNGCRIDRKVTDDIQTRQYRSPEVIIGAEWNETADNWSAACMIFELLTGDFLFDPRSSKDWSRDEDHLALMIELVGQLPPKEWALSGRYSRDFFLNSGKLKHIKKLKFWSLPEVLIEKYKMDEAEAEEISDFLLPMLRWEPGHRQQAADALKHRWLQEAPLVTSENANCSVGASARSGGEDECAAGVQSTGSAAASTATPQTSTASIADASPVSEDHADPDLEFRLLPSVATWYQHAI